MILITVLFTVVVGFADGDACIPCDQCAGTKLAYHGYYNSYYSCGCLKSSYHAYECSVGHITHIHLEVPYAHNLVYDYHENLYCPYCSAYIGVKTYYICGYSTTVTIDHECSK